MARATRGNRPRYAPEPAKRCAVPHSFSAFAAGTRWVSMVSISSMAADSRAAGVIESFLVESDSSFASDEEQNPQREVDPHREQHQHPGKPCEAAVLDIV